MDIEKAIENIKLSKSTFLFGREQTIVNIEDLDTVLNELEKKDKVILEAINYMEETFELEDEKCITELYDILKKAEEK